ncbi:MAG: hypothetical protein PHQ40_20315 [Anaerolineaceae bacterium]|nr:hypothetical protein [Anaerolineaceae bacterium]
MTLKGQHPISIRTIRILCVALLFTASLFTLLGARFTGSIHAQAAAPQTRVLDPDCKTSRIFLPIVTQQGSAAPA